MSHCTRPVDIAAVAVIPVTRECQVLFVIAADDCVRVAVIGVKVPVPITVRAAAGTLMGVTA
jgi:hypothetical protein